MNTEHEAQVREAAAELAAVLGLLNIPASFESDRLVVNGIPVALHEASRPSLDGIRRLLAQSDPSAEAILVADRLGRTQRQLLLDAGWSWLDRSGHLRLRAPGITVDAAIDSLLGPDPTPPDPLARPSALTVALALLHRPDEALSVREVAGLTELSVGSVSNAMSEMEAVGLLDRSRRPRVPELFWEAAARWRVRWFPLARYPHPGIEASVRTLLQFGFDDPLDPDQLERPGWAATGTFAAQIYGMPLVATGAADIYVPSQRALTWALRTWGEARTDNEGSTRLAVPPTPLAVRHRRDVASTTRPDNHWPLVTPLVAALTVASDPDPRARETLLSWQPDRMSDLRRVW